MLLQILETNYWIVHTANEILHWAYLSLLFILQSVLRYNTLIEEVSDAFAITVGTVTVPDKNCVTKRIKACAAYCLPDGKSNMAVIEVNLVSGYISEKSDLKQIVKNNINVIKRYEVDGNKVSFFIDEITAEYICVYFRVIREMDVEQATYGTVVVYDYYQPEFFANKVIILSTDYLFVSVYNMDCHYHSNSNVFLYQYKVFYTRINIMVIICKGNWWFCLIHFLISVETLYKMKNNPMYNQWNIRTKWHTK